MSTPPDPGMPALLLEVARKFGFIVEGIIQHALMSGDYGRIDGHVLSVERAAAPGMVRWVVVRDLPARLAPRCLTRTAYEALRTGELTESGVLMYQGKAWSLADVWDGTRLVADLLPQ